MKALNTAMVAGGLVMAGVAIATASAGWGLVAAIWLVGGCFGLALERGAK